MKHLDKYLNLCIYSFCYSNKHSTIKNILSWQSVLSMFSQKYVFRTNNLDPSGRSSTLGPIFFKHHYCGYNSYTIIELWCSWQRKDPIMWKFSNNIQGEELQTNDRVSFNDNDCGKLDCHKIILSSILCFWDKPDYHI